MSIIEELRRDIEAAELLDDWLGSGGVPVSSEVAEKRAATCHDCIENKPGAWWESVKQMVALWIKKEIEVKNMLNLKLSNEEKLGMCKVCGCSNRLKCWVPLERAKQSKPVEGKAYPPQCWVKTEV